MRLPRIKIHGRVAVYHCMTRVVGGQRLLKPHHREQLRKMLWQQARFAGVQVLTYCLLSNHFHVLVRVPEDPEPTDSELVSRCRAFYGGSHGLVAGLERDLKVMGQLRDEDRQRLWARMGDVSVFMKELKQRFSRWFNALNQRYGTLWAERFKSLLVEDTVSGVSRVAVYIDLNPARAGLVADAKDYRFCGYAEAMGGGKEARSGLEGVYPGLDWAGATDRHRQNLLAGKLKRATPEERREIVKQLEAGVTVAPGQEFGLRIRYLSDGVVLGSRGFVEKVFRQYRQRFGKKRQSGARPIRGVRWEGLHVLRDLQLRVFE